VSFELRALGMLCGNYDPPVCFNVKVATQQAERESLWSKCRETKHPEELKTWHGQFDVVNSDGAASAVQREFSWLKEPPSHQAPGRYQLRIGLAGFHGSFGEDDRDFRQGWSRHTGSPWPAMLRADFCRRTDVQDKKPRRELPDQLKCGMRQDADHASLGRSDHRHLVHGVPAQLPQGIEDVVGD
jgi:hypothetical protein